MKWFKHDSDANQDARLQNVLLDYGLEGFGLYWYCIELIVGKVDQDNLNFELEHDARIIARNTGSTVQRVEEMMKYFIDQGLFENAGGNITCFKIMKRLDKSMTNNHKMREFLTDMKVKSKAYDGYVYFVRADYDDIEKRPLIKIGRSKNVTSRMAELNRRKDCKDASLTLLGKIKTEDCVSLETEFHRKFKHLNVVDEWFYNSKEIVDFINLELRADVNSVRPDYDMQDKITLEDITQDNKTLKESNKSPTVKKPKFCPVHFASSEFQGYEIDLESWTEWCEFRRESKKPITRASASKQLKMLVKYNLDEQKLIIDKSIMNGYQGLFELKNKPAQSNGSFQSEDFIDFETYEEKYT